MSEVVKVKPNLSTFRDIPPRCGAERMRCIIMEMRDLMHEHGATWLRVTEQGDRIYMEGWYERPMHPNECADFAADEVHP